MDMEDFTIVSQKEPKIRMRVTPGHFATSSSHINYFLDMVTLKHKSKVAREVASELSIPYVMNADIETIVCLEQTEVVGAYLAQELLDARPMMAEASEEIRVISPLISVNGQLIFSQATRGFISGKNVILLMATISSGKTTKRALECLEYYGANLAGISALFASILEIDGNQVHAVFTQDDLPDYAYSLPGQCEMCKQGVKLDAIVNAGGYMKI